MTNTSKKLRTTDAPQKVQADTVREAVRQTKQLINAGTITVPAPSGGTGRTIAQRFGDWIEAADYGVIGDSFTDDTAAAQAALNAGAALNMPVHFRNLVVRISSGLTCAGPGLDFDSVPHGISQGPGFYLSGTGYTGVTFTGSPQCVSFCLYGNGQVANGVLFSNPSRAVVQHVRVYNLNGYGCNLVQTYDCLFQTISVELCGNTTTYAFSWLPGADTSNESHIERLQVEQANTQAIYVDPTCLKCVIDNIHSERATVNASYVTWSLGGEVLYNDMRFNASGTSANATVYLNGLNATYTNLRAEGNIVVKWISTGATMTLVTPNIAGSLLNVTNQTGAIEILGGTIATLTADPYGLRAYGCAIGSLTIGVGPNPLDPTLARFENCDITSLVTGASLLAAATFVNCRIFEGHNLLKGLTVLLGCSVTFAGTCTVQAPLYAKGTAFIGNLNTNGLSVFDTGCYCTGTVTGVVAPTAGAWNQGTVTIDLTGATQGAICTVAGTPGTWVTTGSSLAHTLTIGAHLTGGSFNGSANVTIATDAVSTNTASTLVLRDGSGNFAAGTITAALTGNATTATTLATVRTIWGQNFDGSGNVTGAITGATTGSFSGQITSTVTSGRTFFAGSATTGNIFLAFQNTGGFSVLGIESSAGGSIITGSTAYDACFYGPSGISFSGNGGSNVHLRIASTGALATSSTVQIGSRGAFAAGDKYLIVDASGNVHVSALGPAS